MFGNSRRVDCRTQFHFSRHKKLSRLFAPSTLCSFFGLISQLFTLFLTFRYSRHGHQVECGTQTYCFLAFTVKHRRHIFTPTNRFVKRSRNQMMSRHASVLRPAVATVTARILSMSRPRRNFSFSFVGPKTLDDVIKKELVTEKSGAEVADIWYSYHENKVSRIL